MNLDALSNGEIMVIVISRLKGSIKAIDTEDAALEANIIAPGRFAWKKHKDKVDLEIARDALRLETESKPPLLSGSIRDGWMLTAEGRTWIENLPKSIKGTGIFSKKRQSEIEKKYQEECERLRETAAWNKFNSNNKDDISLPEFHEFVRINSYFPSRQRKERISIINNSVKNDKELGELWKYLMERFSEEIRK